MMEKKNKKYLGVMLLCFLFGGFTLIMYFLQAYSILWHKSLIKSIDISQEFPGPRPRNESNQTPKGLGGAPRLLLLISPPAIIYPLSGIVLLAGGVSIWNLLRKREVENTQEKILNLTLQPEEKKVLDMVNKEGGSITQNEIVKNTEFSKVKVHRVIKKLMKKDLVKKKPYGMTNKIISTEKTKDSGFSHIKE